MILVRDTTNALFMIGIIGGIGPTAGADLLQKITEETKAKKDQEHLPVILFSLPQQIEDRTKYLEGKTERNPGVEIARIAVQLHQLGVTHAAVACNTAHAPKIFEQAEKELKKSGSHLQLLHLINENIAYLKANFKKGACIGILGTTGTYKQKIYSSKVEEAGFKAVVPTEEVQNELVHNAIYHPMYGIKTNNGQPTKIAKSQLHYALDIMKEEGAEAVILGCSELPLALEECTYKDMLLIDATRIVARAIIRAYDKEKLKEDRYQKFIKAK
jgi:aspartate racemase